MRNVALSAGFFVALACVVAFAEGPQSQSTPPTSQSLPAVVGLDQLPGRPVMHRELAKLVFGSRVRVMDAWLQGTYLIEHDADRMARGEPCTYIYRLKDPSKPVVTFFCEHLHRDMASKGVVTLKRINTVPDEYELVEFQFAGQAEAHGVPQQR